MKKVSSDDLITRYLDDSASETEMVQLNHLIINSPKVRRQFNEATEHAIVLAQATPTLQSAKTIRFPKWLAVAALICGLLVFVFMLQSKPMAEVVSSGGQIEIPSEKEIASGDTLKTIGMASFLDFRFNDGTLVHLGGDTIATVTGDDQKRLLVHQGSASLNVQPQEKSAPLILTTPTAEITVLGTFFGIFSTDGATRLEVAEGAVDLKRLADGQSVRVGAGQYSVAGDAQGRLGVKNIPKLDSKWSVDFRQTPKKVLGIGIQELNAEGAAIGARGQQGHGAAEVIATRNAWSTGNYAYFRPEKATVLKVRLKMDRPQWLNFIVNFRSPELGSTETLTCLYQDPELVHRVKPGEWQTVELPLAEPKIYGGYFGDLEGLPTGWPCFSVSVSAGDETRGLVIEKIWTE